MKKTERIFDSGDKNTEKIGIYIHIPFCAAKCKYCDFNSHVGNIDEQKKYIAALCREISESEDIKVFVSIRYTSGAERPPFCRRSR